MEQGLRCSYLGMRLTGPLRLSLEGVETAVLEIAAIAQSSLTMTPLGEIRYGKILPDEARKWLQSCAKADMQAESRYPRIAEFHSDGLGSGVTRFEHLVVRDLDLEPLDALDGAGSHAHQDGRIVSHAAFSYHPPNELKQEKSQIQEATTTPIIHATPIELPATGHRELHTYWNNKVEAALDSQFSHLHCFEVRELATLSPSHLRRGIASQLLRWIFPWADKLNVPVVLAATPPGYPLYLRHGFVEVGGDSGIVECNMADWGGIGIHRHILMIRFPQEGRSD